MGHHASHISILASQIMSYMIFDFFLLSSIGCGSGDRLPFGIKVFPVDRFHICKYKILNNTSIILCLPICILSKVVLKIQFTHHRGSRWYIVHNFSSRYIINERLTFEVGISHTFLMIHPLLGYM